MTSIPSCGRSWPAPGKFNAVDAFKGIYRLQDLRRRTSDVWESIDVMALPTTGTTYTVDELRKDPVALNSNLGYYTNFMNLLDLAGLALPAGFRGNGLPFGVTLAAPAFFRRSAVYNSARPGKPSWNSHGLR